jgi:hydrogenase maturation protease
MTPSRILVLGIGNLLMGDEGVGVHAVRELARRPWPDAVTVVDGGTGGFHLLSYFGEYDTIVMIDATMDDQPPGTLSVIEPRYATDFPRSLTAHDIGLRDLVESAALLRMQPKIYLVTVSVTNLQPMETALSAPVAASLGHVVARVGDLIGRVLGESAGSADDTAARSGT